MNVDADIAVIGAGPAGQALAIALAESGDRIVLVDAGAEAEQPPAQADLRVFALSPASTALLRSLDVWRRLPEARVAPYRRMQVWRDDPRHSLRFDAAESGWPELGHIVEHGALQHALAQRGAELANLHRRWDSRVVVLDQDAETATLGLSDGGRLRVRLVVAADGAGSPLRALAGIHSERVDYHQCGLVANIGSESPHEACARQRFLRSGPLALLPLADGGCSIVWSLPEARAQQLRDQPAAEFEAALNAASGGVLGGLRLGSQRVLFPLCRQLATRYIDRRVVLVGDAAHVVHPLAGQGLNLGLLDVGALADVLASARQRRLDPGSSAVLGRYARWRQGDNTLAAHAFEQIDHLYRSGQPVVRTLVDIGMRALDRLSPIRRRLVAHAAGLAGRVPSRCQPRTG